MKTEHSFNRLALDESFEQLQPIASDSLDEPGVASQRGLPLQRILRMVRRKIVLIATITGATSVAALMLTKMAPPIYEGAFRLLVEPATTEARSTDPAALTRAEGGEVPNDLFRLDYPTQIEILRSPGVLNPAVEEIQTRYPSFSYEDLQENLVVQRIGSNRSNETKIIEISYQGSDPALVDLVLREVSERYLQYSLEERKNRITEGVKFIDERLPDLQERVNTLQSRTQQLQQRYGVLNPTTQGDQLSEQVRIAQDQQFNTQRELQEQRRLYANLQRQLGLSPEQAIAASTLSQNPGYQQLLEQQRELESQIALETTRFSEQSPVVRRLRERQQNITELVNKEASTILGQSVGNSAGNTRVLAYQDPIRLELIEQLVNTRNQIQILEIRNQAFNQARQYITQQAGQFPAIARQYNDYQQQLEIANGTLNQLLTQRETLRVEAAQSQLPWEIISSPGIERDGNGNPIAQPGKVRRQLVLGIGLGLLLGLGATLLIEKHEDIFYTSDDLKDGTFAPLLGVIPLQDDPDLLLNPAIAAPLTNKRGRKTNKSPMLFLGAFDALYTSIRFLRSAPQVQSLVVSSATAGDGKTTVAVHLAQTAAGMEQRVLLVDANLRSPQLHNKFNISNSIGLSELLIRDLDFHDAIQRSSTANTLFVLPAGQSLTGTSRLLASARMQELMEKFKAEFDLIIYDTTHLQGMSDATFLATRTDGILMTVEVGKTSRSATLQTLDKLSNFGLSVLGLVANKGKVQGEALVDAPVEPVAYDTKVQSM